MAYFLQIYQVQITKEHNITHISIFSLKAVSQYFACNAMQLGLLLCRKPDIVN